MELELIECVSSHSSEGLTPPQWTEKGGQGQFSDAESILSQRYVHYVGSSEI